MSQFPPNNSLDHNSEPQEQQPRSDSPRDDRPREDRPRDDRPRSDRPYSDRPRDDRPREDRPRFDRPREDRPRDDRPRSDRPREDRPYSDRPREDRPRDDRPRSDRPYSDRPRDDRPREDRPRFDRPREDRPREDRPRFDRPREDRPRDDRPRSDRPYSDRPRDDRPREDRPRDDRPRFDRPREDRPRDDRPRSDRPYSDRPRDDRPREDRPRFDKPRFDSDRPKSDRPFASDDKKKFGSKDKPRRPRVEWQDEVGMLDQEIIELIVKRNRVWSRIPADKASLLERDLRMAWEKKATSHSRDPKFIRQLFALLQTIEVAPSLVETAAFNLAPATTPLNLELPAPTYSRALQGYLALIASFGLVGNFTGITLSSTIMECLHSLNQLGASFRYEEDGQILCREAPATAGYSKNVLDKVIHLGEDPFNLYIVLFQLVTRPSRVKLVGEGNLKLLNISSLTHFLPQLGARLTHVVPGQEGLPARLETSALLPESLAIPTDLPADAVLALILASPSFTQPLELDLSLHPQAQTIIAEAQTCFAALGLSFTQADLKLQLTPVSISTTSTDPSNHNSYSSDNSDSSDIPNSSTTNQIPSFPLSPTLDKTTAFCFMLMPYLVGGQLTFKGAWALPELKSLLQLLPPAQIQETEDGLTLTLEPQQNYDLDLHSLPLELQPLGLVLSLMPSLRVRSGILPSLPESIDLDTLDNFLLALGIKREEAILSPTPSTIWTSPDLAYSLALALAAFIRPQLKLSNPASVTQEIPYFWYVYNGQHQPENMIPPTKTKSERRRIIETNALTKTD